MIDAPDLFVYQADVVRVVDADSVVFNVDLGMRIRAEHSVRLLGVDAPELFSGDDRERGEAARRFTLAWVEEHATDGERWPFILRTKKDSTTFGRYLADVTAKDDGTSLADALTQAGHVA